MFEMKKTVILVGLGNPLNSIDPNACGWRLS
jgi:hypothetical protein